MADHSHNTKYKFVYFPVKGRAEFIRYMFALAEVEYEEEHVQPHDWPNRKPGTFTLTFFGFIIFGIFLPGTWYQFFG